MKRGEKFLYNGSQQQILHSAGGEEAHRPPVAVSFFLYIHRFCGSVRLGAFVSVAEGACRSVGRVCAVLWRTWLRAAGCILYIGIYGRCFLCVFFMGSMLSNSKLLLPLHPIRLRLGVGSHRFFEASRKFLTENLVVKFFIPTFVVQNGSKMPM